jgi:hypothetical protein
MEDASLLSSSQELVPTDRSRLPAALHEPAAPVSRKYDVLMRYAANMTVEATNHLEARKQALSSIILAVFDHGVELVDEAILGVRKSDPLPDQLIHSHR